MNSRLFCWWEVKGGFQARNGKACDISGGRTCVKAAHLGNVSLIMLFLLAGAVLSTAAQQQMSVIVKQTQVRENPTYLAKILAVLSYGNRVTVADQQNGAPRDWVKVTIPEKQLSGWVNVAALTQKKIILTAGSENVSASASSGDVAVAGKGFNESVERQYRNDNSLDYTWVDRMSNYVVSTDEVAAFMKEDGLTPADGAAQ